MDKVMVVVFTLILCMIIAFVMALPFMLLWNYAVVAAFTIVKPINYWVSVCLMIFMNCWIAGAKAQTG